MSINLGTYALVSALAVGGAVAQHEYRQPGDQAQQGQENGSSSAGVPIDCNTLMTHHQQMLAEVTKLDDQARMQLDQMKGATTDRAKLDATMALVETLLTQRKEIQTRTSAMEHETLRFVLSNKSSDLSSTCPRITELLQQANEPNALDPEASERGPDDMEIDADQAPPQ